MKERGSYTEYVELCNRFQTASYKERREINRTMIKKFGYGARYPLHYLYPEQYPFYAAVALWIIYFVALFVKNVIF